MKPSRNEMDIKHAPVVIRLSAKEMAMSEQEAREWFIADRKKSLDDEEKRFLQFMDELERELLSEAK